MYKKVSTNLNFVEREKQTEKFWKDNDIFKKSMDSRKEGETYTFYDGPPTANGKPHIGHVLTRVIKDMIPRYQTMKGHMVPRKAGWDTHGLPVELEVEKIEKTFINKDVIEDFSVIVSNDDVIEKNYSFSAGQYFEIKIEYIEMTEEEFIKYLGRNHISIFRFDNEKEFLEELNNA